MPVRSRALLVASVAVIGALAGLVVLPLTSRTSGWVGPGRVAVHAGLHSDGRTVIELPPLGRLSTRMPGTPVRLDASVVELDLAKTQALALSPDPRARLDEVGADELLSLLRRMAIQAVLFGALAGAVATAVLPGRRWWFPVLGAGSAVVGIVLLGLLTWQRFDVDAFEQPRFEGALERAPAIIDAARRHVDDLQGVEDRVRTLGDQLADLYAASSTVNVGVGADGETRILHVSDLHSNPLGLEFVDRIARSFEVDAVLDTGDLTSFGYPLEARIAELVSRVPVPYYYVAGNHDSPANRVAIAGFPNVRVLASTVEEVAGVRILGVPDPSFTATNETTTAEANQAKDDAAVVVASLVKVYEPDVLAVHDVRQAVEAFGEVPVIVGGHSHERQTKKRDGTVAYTVGSTGAGGLGTFMVASDEAYEAQVLHFRGGRLVAIDYVTLEGISGDLSIERDVVAVTPDP